MPDKYDVARASKNRLRSKGEQGGTSSIGPEKTDMDATEKEKLTSGLSSGKAVKGGGDDMPKQQPGEDPGAYGERVRRWRAGRKSATMDQAAGALAGRMKE